MTVGRCLPCVYVFINMICSQIGLKDTVLHGILAGQEGPEQKKEYQKLNRQIKNVVDRYHLIAAEDRVNLFLNPLGHLTPQ